MKLSLRTVTDRCRTEADAWEFLEELRWHGRPVCPHCGVIDGHYFLNAKHGGRKTRTGTISERRVWKCHACRKQFTAAVGTIFHGTKVEIRTWLMVLVQVSSAKNGISAREVERMHGVTAETAWHMLHRIREAMTRDPLAGLLSGTIEADETYIGGKPKNKHRRADQGHHYNNTAAKPLDNKTPVFALVNRETGEVRSRVMPRVTGDNLRNALRSEVNVGNSTLYTDELVAYRQVGPEFVEHSTVRHGVKEYARGPVTTNRIEGYFSQLKRSIDGTHHHVSATHLGRYLAHFDFMYSTRKLTDSDRMVRIIDQAAGRRLPYRPLSTG
jgi:transposase-like protein